MREIISTVCYINGIFILRPNKNCQKKFMGGLFTNTTTIEPPRILIIPQYQRILHKNILIYVINHLHRRDLYKYYFCFGQLYHSRKEKVNAWRQLTICDAVMPHTFNVPNMYLLVKVFIKT